MLRLRPHLLTLLIVSTVVVALAAAQLRARGGFGIGGGWSITSSYSHGWPTRALSRTVTRSIVKTSPRVEVESIRYEWSAYGLLIDAAASMLVVASTIFSCEHWRRNMIAPWQFSIRQLLIVVTIAAILVVLCQNETWFYWELSKRMNGGVPRLYDGFGVSPWLIAVPMILGVGCVIYTCGWGLVALLSIFSASIRSWFVTGHGGLTAQ